MIRIKLNWDDNSSNEDKFVIERKEGVSWTQVGEVTANAEEFVDYTAKFNTEYTYRVRAELYGNQSDPTNEVIGKAIGLQMVINPYDDTNVSVVKSGLACLMITPSDNHTRTNNITIYENDSGEYLIIVDNKTLITSINLGSTLGITGEIDLTGFTSLTSFIAKNGNFQLKVDSGLIQRANINFDVTNSIITEDKLITLIDRIIIANGGTTTDDGTDYTGDAGATYSSRVLTIGTLTIDISIVTNKILYQKIQALTAVGWTINTVKTVCQKVLIVDTNDSYYAVTSLEKTTEVVSLIRDSGNVLFVDMYNSEANANAGGATGKLTTVASVAGIQDWIDSNTWADGVTYYLRFFSTKTTSIDNISEFTYKAYPTEDRPCGAIVDITGLSSYIAISSRKILVSGFSGDFYTYSGSDITALVNQNVGNPNLTVSGSGRAPHPLIDNAFNFHGNMRYRITSSGFALNPFAWICRYKIDSENTVGNVVANTNQGTGLAVIGTGLGWSLAVIVGKNGVNISFNEGGSYSTKWLSTKVDEWVTVGVLVEGTHYRVFENDVLVFEDYDGIDMADKIASAINFGTVSTTSNHQYFDATEFIIYDEPISDLVYQKIYQTLNS